MIQRPFSKAPWGALEAGHGARLAPTILMRIDFPKEPPENDVEARFISARKIAVTEMIA